MTCYLLRSLSFPHTLRMAGVAGDVQGVNIFSDVVLQDIHYMVVSHTLGAADAASDMQGVRTYSEISQQCIAFLTP